MRYGPFQKGWKQFGQYGLRRAFGAPALGQGVGGTDVLFTGRLGVRPNAQSIAAVQAFDTWLGRAADYILVFPATNSWALALSSADQIVSDFAGDARPKIWSIGTNTQDTTLDQAAAGNFDANYTSMAQKILADAPATGQIMLRVNHEFNLGSGGHPWNVVLNGKTAEFKTAFQRLVTRFRAVSNRFRFTWNPNWTSSTTPQFDVTTCYPGDAYVDIIGLDLYYYLEYDDTNPVTAFNYARDQTYGLQWQVNFARSHGRALAMCEFATNWDRPQWIDLMYSWFTQNRYAYSNYWDANVDFSGRLSDGSYPDSGARFIKDFKDGGPIPLFNHTFYWTDEGFYATGAATFSRVSSVARITNVSDYSQRAERSWTGLTIGATYRVEMDIHTGGKAALARVNESSGAFAQLGGVTTTNSALTHVSFTFVATMSTVLVRVTPYAGDATQVVQFDNVQLFAV